MIGTRQAYMVCKKIMFPFIACTCVYKSELSDYFPVDLENDESGFSVSSRSYVGDNSPQQAFITGNYDSGWQPTSQETGEWLEMRVFTVRYQSVFWRGISSVAGWEVWW